MNERGTDEEIGMRFNIPEKEWRGGYAWEHIGRQKPNVEGADVEKRRGGD